MDERNKDYSGKGIGAVALLTIVFVALKLTGQITWTWLWVLSPLWISAGLGLLFLLLSLIIIMLFRRKKRNEEEENWNHWR